MRNNNKKLLLLGIGNVLWADEGFGVRTIDAFHQQYTFAPHCASQVTIMDGGTQGLYLVPHVQQADILVVFDAIDYGLPAGSLKTIRDQDVPTFMGAKKMSLHQTGFQEVLATAQLLGDAPESILLIGVQPDVLDDYGGSLRPIVKAQIQPAIAVAIDYLETLGFSVIKRQQPLSGNEHLADASLAIHDYESHRPSASDACRSGDQRILSSSAYTFDPKQPLTSGTRMQIDLDKRVQSQNAISETLPHAMTSTHHEEQ